MPKTYLNYAKAVQVIGFQKSTVPEVSAMHQET